MTNFFEQAGERQMNGAQRAKERRVERVQARQEQAPMVPTPLEKKQQEDAILLSMFRKQRREMKAEMAAAHGADFKTLMRMLLNLDWTKTSVLVDHVRDAWWLRRADVNTRLETLGYIDESIIRARIRHGLPEFDDGIPFGGEEDPPQILIRKYLTEI